MSILLRQEPNGECPMDIENFRPIALAAFVMAAVQVSTSNQSAAQAVQPAVSPEFLCGSHTDVVSALQREYGEKRISRSLTNGGAVIEVFASEGGSFSVLLTAPNGTACMISAGDSWEGGLRGAARAPNA